MYCTRYRTMEFSKKFRKGCFLSDWIAFLCVVIFLSCFSVVLIGILKLPDVSHDNERLDSYRGLRIRKVSNDEVRLGELGEIMVGMLPDDLAFTVFVPSVEAFKRDLKLSYNGSLDKQSEDDNTYATLSRVLGFSAVPRCLLSVDLPMGREAVYDSISGFRLYVMRDSDATLVVNRVSTKRVDLKKGQIVVHIINGVIMDAEFEQSVPDDDDDREN